MEHAIIINDISLIEELANDCRPYFCCYQWSPSVSPSDVELELDDVEHMNEWKPLS